MKLNRWMNDGWKVKIEFLPFPEVAVLKATVTKGNLSFSKESQFLSCGEMLFDYEATLSRLLMLIKKDVSTVSS